MKWHLDFTQHTNQFGFALTVGYVDGREIPDEAMSEMFACGHCGVNVPQVHFEVTLFVWTLMLITHKEVE